MSVESLMRMMNAQKTPGRDELKAYIMLTIEAAPSQMYRMPQEHQQNIWEAKLRILREEANREIDRCIEELRSERL